MITFQETTAPPTHSRCPTVLFPHPREKQEEEAAAGTGKQGRTRKAITPTRQHGQRNKKRHTCSLSIRRISLLRPPATGGERLPSHSQTTSASTPPSGEFDDITAYCSCGKRAAHHCLCVWVHRIDFSTVQKEDYPGWPIMNPRRTGRSRQDNQT